MLLTDAKRLRNHYRATSRIMSDKTLSKIIDVNEDTVSCDGGEVGHPVVYLALSDNSKVECPYCSQIFRLKKIGKHPA